MCSILSLTRGDNPDKQNKTKGMNKMENHINKIKAILEENGFEMGVFKTDKFTRLYFNKHNLINLNKKYKVYLNWNVEDFAANPENFTDFSDENITKYGVLSEGSLADNDFNNQQCGYTNIRMIKIFLSENKLLGTEYNYNEKN